MNQDVFVARKRGGLCNNLKCYLSSMRYARQAGSKLVTECADLDQVYDGLILVEPETETSTLPGLSDWRLHIFPEDDLSAGFAASSLAIGYGGNHADGKDIDFEYERIPSGVQATYLTLLRSLTIKPHLKTFVDAFVAEYFNQNMSSIHMRTWMTDSWDKAPKRHAHFFSFDSYVAAIESCLPHSIFLSSDNASYAEKLKSRFGDAIVTLPSDHGLNAIEEAFVSLLLLSKNPILFGSNVSTFTEMAWWYSDCKAKVTLL